MMRSPDDAARARTARTVWTRPTMRGCVVAAALLALWTAPGVADTQAIGDTPGFLDLLAADATSQPAPETPFPTEAVARNAGEGPDENGVVMDEFAEGAFPEPADQTPSSTPPPAEAPTLTSTNASTNSTTDAPTKEPSAANKPTKAPLPTEAPTEEPTKAPTTTPPTPPTPTTATPAMRTHPVDATPAVGGNISNANASHVHGASGSVSPVLLAGMAAFCAVFLFVWSRRRRGGAEGGGGGAGADASTMSGMATTSSTEKSGGEGKKVQYSRIEDRPEEDDDDAEFGGRSGSWDDWEGSGGAHSHRITVSAREEKEEDDSDSLEDTRGTAKLTKGLGSSSSSSSVPSPPRSFGGSVRTSTAGVKLSSPPPASTGSLQHDRLKEIVLAETKQQKAPSVASNSSNESFEVVHEQPLDLLSGSLSTPKPPQVAAPVSAPEEDLFSQFGMVPTFKKSVQQPPAPVARSTQAAEPLNPFAASPPPSVSASSLFAADLEDVSVGVADASNEWGEEDDDWVQGL